jgi:glycosyltransferase involved in cell wall biosynthesis
MKKKLVFFINNLTGGGAERVVSNLLNSFSETYDCHLILMENSIGYELDKRVAITILNEQSKLSGLKRIVRLPIVAYKLSRVIKRHKIDTVVSFLYRANYVNVLARLFAPHRTILSERIAPSSMYSDATLTSFISKVLIKRLYNYADLIISVSKAIELDLKNAFNISTEQVVIYNPYDISKIKMLSEVPVNMEIDKSKSLISVGSFVKRKNHALLLKAFSKTPTEYTLYLLGEGGEKLNLINLTKELGISNRVVFLGFDTNPYRYLSRCSVFVMASNSEGFPNVLVEAMACGCSVISTDCLSGPREILAPESVCTKQLVNTIEMATYGVLVGVNNVEVLSDGINKLISDASLREMYSKKNTERVVDFNQEKIKKLFEKVLF